MKSELLEVVERARVKELETLVPHVDDGEPDKAGGWTVRDTVAHLAAWRDYAVAEIDAGLAGRDSPELAADEATQNAKLYAETHGLPAKEVLDRAARSWADLAGRISACSEEDLQRPRPGRAGQRLWEAVRGNGFGHLAEHIGYWYVDAGDESGAERTIVWARDLAKAIPDPAEHGNGEYNLACFYARRGRRAEALRHLEPAFELNPGLREWARTDADLDPVRADPAVARLLEAKA